MDTESMYWIGIVVFAAVVFLILGFTAGQLFGEPGLYKATKRIDPEVHSELVALQSQVDELRFELRRTTYRK